MLKALLEWVESGRVGPCQEDLARKDGGVGQWDNKVGGINVPLRFGSQP